MRPTQIESQFQHTVIQRKSTCQVRRFLDFQKNEKIFKTNHHQCEAGAVRIEIDELKKSKSELLEENSKLITSNM